MGTTGGGGGTKTLFDRDECFFVPPFIEALCFSTDESFVSPLAEAAFLLPEEISLLPAAAGCRQAAAAKINEIVLISFLNRVRRLYLIFRKNTLIASSNKLIVRYAVAMSDTLNILFFGDIIGKPGRRALVDYLKSVRSEADLVIANAENAAHGFGVQESHVKELSEAGVMVFSGGNHTFDRREIFDFIDSYPNLLRPANYPEGTPGRGHLLLDLPDCKVGIINLHGRVFMEPLRSPFLVADELVAELSKETSIIFVDIHAEATAEKMAMGWHLDGRVSAVVGTHTHVQTADERILPGGTAYLTDAGACGPVNGVIGMRFEGVYRRMIQQLPSRFEVAEGPAAVCGVKVVVDKASGRALSISRLRYEETQGS